MKRFLTLLILISLTSCNYKNEYKDEFKYDLVFSNYTSEPIDWVNLVDNKKEISQGYLNENPEKNKTIVWCTYKFSGMEMELYFYYLINDRVDENKKVTLKVQPPKEDYNGKKVELRIYRDKVEVHVLKGNYE